jgi:hypothetical protein
MVAAPGRGVTSPRACKPVATLAAVAIELGSDLPASRAHVAVFQLPGSDLAPVVLDDLHVRASRSICMRPHHPPAVAAY